MVSIKRKRRNTYYIKLMECGKLIRKRILIKKLYKIKAKMKALELDCIECANDIPSSIMCYGCEPYAKWHKLYNKLCEIRRILWQEQTRI